jgi:hypothetical protein
MRTQSLWRVTRRALRDWWDDNCLRLAASLAFYTALSLAPLVLLVVGLAGLVVARQQVAGQLAAQLAGLMGPAGRELVHTILAATPLQGGTLATVLGLGTLLIGATAVFGELQATMNLVWEVQPAPTGGVGAELWAWLKQRLFSSSAPPSRLPPPCSRARSRRSWAASWSSLSRCWSSHPCLPCCFSLCRMPRSAGATCGWAGASRRSSSPSARPRSATTSAGRAWARPTAQPGRWWCSSCGSITRP